ncbi:hypothetical protein VTL71DRAFT_12212 [Oculimacula yallundae]|uniref:Uncharacterized protein n=1 Tax=Oculimacula yallundae TaxID=86028 RepID=A0ABR4CSL4_9HELO
MRLLELTGEGELSLTEFASDNIPPYAILSHTWGQDGDEVTFQDLSQSSDVVRSKAGYHKLKFCGERATHDNLHYFWVDTCCINKTSSAELQEAITSMFRWYRHSSKCYVYLSDVLTEDDPDDQDAQSSQSWELAFSNSKWFTRGWTLQELIAPPSVEFFSSSGVRLGNKQSLEQQIHEITRISISALQGRSLLMFSVPERFSWAESRETKRKEDKAYSLLGIFDVTMPLIYGEGETSALERLSEEIYKHSAKRHREEISQALPTSTKRSRIQDNLAPDTTTSSTSPLETPNSTEAAHGIDAATKLSLVEQLYFAKIDERLTSLSAAQGKTCRWFLTTPEFISWNEVAQQQVHGGFLWIKGHPGTGKSTLMKLLFEETKLNTKSNPLQLTLSFFFLARGTVEEKSSIGLYRSLLHQLFSKVVELRDTLEWMTADGAKGVQRNGWNEETLKHTMVHVIKNLGSRSLTIFVDALDECDINQTADMVAFFEELCDHAGDSNVRLQICLSSRHYPAIMIQKGIEVILEHELGHTQDIEQYLKSKLRLGKSKSAESLRSEILEKSSSIFLWVVLVLDILNSEYPNGSGSIKKIRDRLSEIPPKLTDLFELILARDGQNLDELQICLKWILFASRPLKPQELYFAIQIHVDKECSGCWDKEDVDLDQIKAYVRSSSKGLAEVTRNKASEVQFIHESVRDFLLGRYGLQWSGTSGKFSGRSHEDLKDCCLAQLDSPAIGTWSLLTGMWMPINHPAYPFLEYAVQNVLYHANISQQNDIEQGDFIKQFPLRQWISLNNCLEKFEIRRYTNRACLMYILAEKNLVHLIRTHPRRESCFEVGDERYGPPIFAALATENNEAVQAMLEILSEKQSPSSTLRVLLDQSRLYRKGQPWINLDRALKFSQNKGILNYLLQPLNEVIIAFYLSTVPDIDIRNSSGLTPLLWAVHSGNESVVKLLLDTSGGTRNPRDDQSRWALLSTFYRQYMAVIKALLEEKGDDACDLYLEDSSGQGLLCLAVSRQDRTLVEGLLGTEGFDVNAKGFDNRTPLSLAVHRKYKAMVELLLKEQSIDVNLKDGNGWTPLYQATRHGDKDVIKLLLAMEDIDINLGQPEETPLHVAVDQERVDVIKLLLARVDINVNSANLQGETPLHTAVRRWHRITALPLLLERNDIDINRVNDYGRTPLHTAAINGTRAHMKLLLSREDVNINAADNSGYTALHYVSRHAHESSFHEGKLQILLARAEINTHAEDNDGRTPLHTASQYGNKATMKTLLAKDAFNIHAVDNDGRTPLHAAAQGGRGEIIQLLLRRRDINIHAVDKYGMTSLDLAVTYSHADAVTLLRAKDAELLKEKDT